MKNCKNKTENMIEQFCIISDNTINIRGRNELGAKSRENTQKKDYYIKVDTTPWIENNSFRNKSSSQTPTLKKFANLRKKFTKLSEDINRSLNIPVKLEEKLSFIGEKLTNLNGKLSSIEKIFKVTKKGQKDIGMRAKIKAAIFIQRAFRDYLKKRHKNYQKIDINQYLTHMKLKNSSFVMNRKSKNFQKTMLLPTKIEKGMQTTRQVKIKSKIKPKGLIQSIIFIQKNVRGFIIRKKYNNIRNSIIKIQKTFKMFQTRKIFNKIIHARAFIQQQYRKHSETRKNLI